MNDDISVVMPVGAVEPELTEQLRALAEQDFSGTWELIISLNTPDPEQRRRLEIELATFRRAAPDVSVSVEDSSDVRSASHARNAGASASKYERLAFCDSDDVADRSWLTEMSAALSSHRAVGGHLDEHRLAVAGQEHWRPPATPGGNPSFLGHDFLVSANMGVWADDFHAVGGFDETLLRGEDIAFSWSLLRRGVELGHAATAIVHYRHRKGLIPMLKQHYLYGRGMTQILARVRTPTDERKMFTANGQKVDAFHPVHVLRRGSIAAGRLVGLMLEPFHSRHRAPSGR